MTFKRTGQPHEPPEYDNSIVASLRAVARGIADETQQKKAWDWIVYQLAAYNDLSYWPGGDDGRATAFKEGRRFVGAQMLKMLQPALTPSEPDEAPPKRVRRKT